MALIWYGFDDEKECKPCYDKANRAKNKRPSERPSERVQPWRRRTRRRV